MDSREHLVKGTKWDKDGRLVVEFHDAQSALDKILRAQGAYKDNLDITSGGKPILQRVKGFDDV
jgi:nitric oxide reductase activation protein